MLAAYFSTLAGEVIRKHKPKGQDILCFLSSPQSPVVVRAIKPPGSMGGVTPPPRPPGTPGPWCAPKVFFTKFPGVCFVFKPGRSIFWFRVGVDLGLPSSPSRPSGNKGLSILAPVLPSCFSSDTSAQGLLLPPAARVAHPPDSPVATLAAGAPGSSAGVHKPCWMD